MQWNYFLLPCVSPRGIINILRFGFFRMTVSQLLTYDSSMVGLLAIVQDQRENKDAREKVVVMW